MSSIKRDKPREILFTPNINPYATGSVMAEFGNTKVHITATVEDDVPGWLRGRGTGWVTAEYSMLPGSTHDRVRRERKGTGGRTMEIQRLIARCLRAAVDMEKLGERLITVDCDVLVADGGTRTTSISGGYIALAIAINKLLKDGVIETNPLVHQVAALSVGINSDGDVIADLNYEEDSSCHTDMNVVMTQSGDFVEVQGTAEGKPFTPTQLENLLTCSKTAMEPIFKAQNEIINQ